MIQLELISSEDTTLTEALLKAYPDLSSTKLKKFYAQNRVMKNNFLAEKDSPLLKGDKLSILKKPSFAGNLTVYYEDKDVLVVEKPAFLLSVDSDKNPGTSVHSSLKRTYGLTFPVQRLDRETTGVMVFARTREAKESFWHQFEERLVERSYLAITYGVFKEKMGTWRSFLLEGEDLRMKMDSRGQEAITHFEVKKIIRGSFSLISCKLETGKKNQIRVQAAHEGHPLIGDSRYGDDKKGSPLLLHAQKLSFTHPVTGKKLSFISPIPKHFRKITSKMS
jgi:23S rRNA pseudouridine1911/1915/1917 synthase